MRIAAKAVPTACKGKTLHHGRGHMLGQVVQRDCGISILGYFQNISSQDPEQPDLTRSQTCFEKEVGPATSRDLLQLKLLSDFVRITIKSILSHPIYQHIKALLSALLH